MNEPSAFQVQPVPVKKTSNKKRLLIIFFIILALLLIGLGAFYLVGGNTKRHPAPLTTVPTLAPQPQPVATAIPEASHAASLTVTPVATPAAALDRTTIRVSVQNGSGTAGAAQKYATILQNAGYTKVTSGNADKFTYTDITIHVTKKFSDYLPLLQKDITKGDTSAKITTSVDDTISTDAEVIVGK